MAQGRRFAGDADCRRSPTATRTRRRSHSSGTQSPGMSSTRSAPAHLEGRALFPGAAPRERRRRRLGHLAWLPQGTLMAAPTFLPSYFSGVCPKERVWASFKHLGIYSGRNSELRPCHKDSIARPCATNLYMLLSVKMAQSNQSGFVNSKARVPFSTPAPMNFITFATSVIRRSRSTMLYPER
ncbi:hypothetical protein EJB05_53652 [Eragrostis curvula]|uniref:Uncharacterized protein n=1 Tax=Eragrostis curvula TaxID=38414 RepID=A0A5J9SPK7_9POAL|nr:hypothetical protein EJB05_53652 [Eragrostis curvula]